MCLILVFRFLVTASFPANDVEMQTLGMLSLDTLFPKLFLSAIL